MREDALRRRDGEGRATPGEADGGEGVAGVRVVALAGVVDLRARDGRVEGLDRRRGAVDDGGAGVDDRLEAGVGVLRADDGLGAGRLPETGRGVDVVVLDVARVLGGIGAAEEERGAARGEVEAENALADLALANERVEEGVLQRALVIVHLRMIE